MAFTSAYTSRLGLGLVIAASILSASCARVREIAESRGTTTPVTVTTTTTPTTTTPASPTLRTGGAVVAFPGAEGFGANARGGRGGAVCRVKTLAHDGPGSLQACFDANGARTVVFDVSGVIEGPLEIKHGRLTVAGQTSPGGIIVKGGVICDNVYDPNDCNDVIVRHVRFRGGAPDSFRIGGAHDIILDHCSFATADDENIEITRASNITIQHAVIAEPRGDHYQWGGVLINYSKDGMPLQGITIHHSVWNGVAGRLPEISCEENGDGVPSGGKSNCSGHTISLELSNNVMWDASDPIWFNRCTGTNQGNDCPINSATNVNVRMNMIGNVLVRRSTADADAPMAVPDFFAAGTKSIIYVSDNAMFRGSSVGRAPEARTKTVRQPFPVVTYTPSTVLVATLARSAGAFPRDRMDERLASYLSRPIDTRPPSWRNGNGIDVGDAFAARTPTEALPIDTDGDGIPDAWEKARGLNAASAADGSSLGRATGCAAGYSALECYVNQLADTRTNR